MPYPRHMPEDVEDRVDKFIADAIEGDPDVVAKRWAEEVDQLLRDEIGGEPGFLAALFERIIGLADEVPAAVSRTGTWIYRRGREAATACLAAAQTVLERVGRTRPKVVLFLSALVERYRDLLNRIAVSFGAVGFSIGISGAGPSFSFNFQVVGFTVPPKP